MYSRICRVRRPTSYWSTPTEDPSFIFRSEVCNVYPADWVETIWSTSELIWIVYICIGTLCEVLPALRLGRRVIASERDQRVWAEGMKILRTEVKVDSSQWILYFPSQLHSHYPLLFLFCFFFYFFVFFSTIRCTWPVTLTYCSTTSMRLPCTKGGS